jgi:hypothetical protein
MKRAYLVLALVAVAVFAACSGPGGGLPSTQGSSMGSMAPQAAPISAIRHIYARLSFDGTAFTEVADANCGHRGLGGMTPYAAPTSGPLTLAGSVTVTPRCVPSPMPSTVPQLYVFAIRLSAHHGGDPRAAHFGGVMIAGPANVSDNPWVLAPTAPGLTMVGGAKYDFVVATMWAHPSPEPSPSPSSSP